MRPVRVPRLDLHLQGLDPALVREALEALPDALGRALAAPPSGAGGGATAHARGRPAVPPTAHGPIRLERAPSAAELARRIAERVASEARRSGAATDRAPSRAAAPDRLPLAGRRP